MRYVLPLLLTFATLAFAQDPASAADEKPTEVQVEFFEKKIRPILANHCHKCHGPNKQEGELRLDSKSGLKKGGESGPVVKPGHPEESELIAAINYGADSFQMPPDGKLKPSQIALLTKWVKTGAPWPGTSQASPATSSSKTFNLNERAQHWSFQPIQQSTIPTPQQINWPRNPVDRFILAHLEEANLTPAPSADRRTLLRRLSYDLTGLPPTIEELEEFLNDTSPTAYERQVERLLASTRYGERWARHWLDLVRFAETGGHEFDYEIPHAWPYRDYVIRAFNQDLPYNQFVIEHIAGDLLKSPRRRPSNGDNESVIGTAFYWFCQGKHSPVDIRAEECDAIDNQIDVFGKTFLGLTIACARCHDHKFDPIRANDYYALAGYLQSSRRQLAILDDPAKTQSVIGQIKQLRTKHRHQVTDFEASRLLGKMDRLIKLLQSETTSPKAVAKNQSKELKQTALRQKQLTELAQRDPTHVFYPWTQLRKQSTKEGFTATRSALVQQLRDRKQAAASRPNLVDFDEDSYGKWFADGPAFQQRPPRTAEVVWREQRSDNGSAIIELIPPGVAHSGVLSQHLQGTLRSPTFKIERRYVHYRVKRTGGPKRRGGPLKSGQINLIVDGFQYIKNPLYGGLAINLDNSGFWHWVRQDVGKYIDSNAYIEFDDASGGSMAIDQVQLSDSPQPIRRPNELVVSMLDDPALETVEQLAEGYRRLCIETLQMWKADRLASDAQSADRIAIVNRLLQSESLLFGADKRGNNETEGRQVDAILAKFRNAVAASSAPRRVVAMTDGSPENEHLLIRGNHTKAGPEVPRRFLEVLHNPQQPVPQSGSGRLQLARQVASPKNPLTARVLVNRLWQHHFGRGLVASPDNFGLQGSPPSHPQLLDWLAREFINSGWSIKHMHRLMLTSSTYRMSSRSTNPQAEQSDPSNVLLHRMNIQRLEGEAIRDGLLAISGRLDERKFGPGVLPHLSPFMEGRGRPRSGPLDGNGRRSIYIDVRRNFLTPLFLAFDFPSPSTTIGRRSVSNVPAQALTLMNNPFIIQQATAWANRTLNKTQASGGRQPADLTEVLTRQRIETLYESAFSRPPTGDELTAAISFLEEQGKEYNGADDPRTWADLCHVLLNVKEFVFVN